MEKYGNTSSAYGPTAKTLIEEAEYVRGLLWCRWNCQDNRPENIKHQQSKYFAGGAVCLSWQKTTEWL